MRRAPGTWWSTALKHRVCLCVSVCVLRVPVCPISNSFLITPRIGTKVVSVDR